jgi:Rrf2 family protein
MWSKTTEYAIRALIYIALSNKECRRPGFREVAEGIDAPVQFTAKILQTLVRSGLLSSIRGKGGGFFFGRNAEDLKLSDVITAFEGKDYFIGCALGLRECDAAHPCPLHDEFVEIRTNLEVMAKRETVQGLALKIEGGSAKLKRD